MSRYERAYGTDWDSLDRDRAIERAYALGVAAGLGESHPEELDAIRAEMATVYDRSVVDLAYDEGKSECRRVGPADCDGRTVWAALVEGERDTDGNGNGEGIPDRETDTTGGHLGLPDAIGRIEALARSDRDSTDALDRPGFLDRD
jgi:hypothetical protein